MIAEIVSSVSIIAALYAMEPNGPAVPHYGEISEAIASASNQDPIFPHHKDGAVFTAAVLVSLAWHESRFMPNAVGDNGKSFGLFQIQPPTGKVKSNVLLNVKDSSLIAVDLIRTSFKQCEKRPIAERLSWYVSSRGCPSKPTIVKKSISRMLVAERKVMPLLLAKKAESGT